MAHNTNKSRSLYYYQVLIGLLEADLGAYMAKQVIGQYCHDLGIKETDIRDHHLIIIAQRLEKALEPFLSPDEISALSQQISTLKEYDDWGTI